MRVRVESSPSYPRRRRRSPGDVSLRSRRRFVRSSASAAGPPLQVGVEADRAATAPRGLTRVPGARPLPVADAENVTFGLEVGRPRWRPAAPAWSLRVRDPHHFGHAARWHRAGAGGRARALLMDEPSRPRRASGAHSARALLWERTRGRSSSHHQIQEASWAIASSDDAAPAHPGGARSCRPTSARCSPRVPRPVTSAGAHQAGRAGALADAP